MATNDELDKRYSNPLIDAGPSPFGRTFEAPPGIPEGDAVRPDPARQQPLDKRRLEDVLSNIEGLVGGNHEVALLLIEARDALEEL